MVKLGYTQRWLWEDVLFTLFMHVNTPHTG
jgi:hypothetical protein